MLRNNKKQSKENKTKQNQTPKLGSFWEGWTTKHSSKTIHYSSTEKKWSGKFWPYVIWRQLAINSPHEKTPVFKAVCLEVIWSSLGQRVSSLFLAWAAWGQTPYSLYSGTAVPLEVWRTPYRLPLGVMLFPIARVPVWGGKELRAPALLAMAPAVACRVAPTAAAIASLLPCPCEMMIQLVDHTELNAQGRLLI